MKTADLRRAYQTFFLKSEAGAEFMKWLDSEITARHESAETTPENARDAAQQARGIRSVKLHIDSLVAERRR